LGQGERSIASLIPKPVPALDIRALPIGPMEAFVLSRVDGRASDAEIALLTGLGVADVTQLLRRLDDLGAVSYGQPPTSPSGPKHAPPPKGLIGVWASGAQPRQPPVEAPVITDAPDTPDPPDTPPSDYDPAELDEPADIAPARKRTVLDLYYKLDKLSHYELLGVTRTANKKAIKSSYFGVVSTFHPDKYYGKSLGSFKPKLERIFQRVTQAHDTLTHPKQREEYDRFLDSQLATRALDIVANPAASLPEVDEIFREMEREARLAAAAGPSSVPSPDPGAQSHPRPAATGGAAPLSVSSSAPPLDAAVRARPPATAEERRRAFARKLGASVPPPGGRVPPAIDSIPVPSAREAAADALKQRYEAHLARARNERLNRYIQAADDAVAAKNMIAATNALRIAVSLAPDDAALVERFESTERQAAAALADQYIEQARYEERRGEFALAAQAYERAVRGRPSAHLHERAAHCFLEIRTDPKKASDHARKAVEMAPRDITYRITLARVYARAGMEQSALGELERARTLDPSDDTIKDWIKRVKRGEI
jgi:curved DNA-binding protein CbpA